LRARELQTANPLAEFEAAMNLEVSLGTTFKALAAQPMTTELASRVSTGVYAGMTEDQREERRQLHRDIQNRRMALESDLVNEFDPIKIEKLNAEIDGLLAQDEKDLKGFVTQSIKEGRLLDTPDLEEKYGDLLEFDGPMTDAEAAVLYEGKKEELIRNAIVNAGPKGVVPGVVKFGGSMAAMAQDPLEVASLFIPFVGQGRAAYYLSRYGKVKGRAIIGGIEGFLGSVVTEPIYYGLSKNQQLDYTMGEALLNVGLGTFLGSGLGSVIGALRKSEVPINVDALVEAAPTLRKEDIAKPISMAEAIEKARLSRDGILRSNDVLGGKATAEMAIRQMVNDHSISVDLSVPKIPKKPLSLNAFVREQGGINDQDVTFRGELNNLGIREFSEFTNKNGNVVNGVSNPKSKKNLDNMAEIAFEAGFISDRNTSMLVDALRREDQGDLVFAQQDLEAAQAWRIANDAVNDVDAELSRRKDIKEELSKRGNPDASDDELALISDAMSRKDLDIDEAIYETGVSIERTREDLEVAYALDSRFDPFADYEAAEMFEQRVPVEDLEQLLDESLESQDIMIRQMIADGELDDELRLQFEEIIRVELEEQAYEEVVNAVSVCVARS